MKVLQVFKQGKISEERCEDEYFISEDFAAAIDGVTSKSDFLYQGKTTGRLAAELVCGVLGRMEREASLSQVTTAVNEELRGFCQNVGFPEDYLSKGPQAVCAIYSDFRREIWLVGDCQASVDGVIYQTPIKGETVLAQMRGFILNALEKEGKNLCGEISSGRDEAREVIIPWIHRISDFANDPVSEYGYSVFNGGETPESLIQVVWLDERRHEVVLASDGYLDIKPTLEETEEALARLLRRDPGLYRSCHSVKGLASGQNSYDDRVYVRLRV